MVRDSMAAALRPSSGVLLQALQISVYPGVGGSGSACCRCPLGAKRYLLTDNIVKLKEFQHKKVAIACNLPGTKETYFRNLEEKLSQNKLILKEELITLLHLCESRDHVELAKNVIYRYHAENRNITRGEYKFGPLFMRLCYELDLEESAVELMKDQNSPESFKICSTLREEALLKGEILPRRASCFAVALALNQNEVAQAMSIFSQIMNPESITCTNLNIILHIQLNMLENVIEILKNATEGNLSKYVKRQVFSEEVLAKVREKVKDVPALVAKFDELYGKLHVSGQVTTYSLDAVLCHIPGGRKSHMFLLNKRMVSRRTFQPLGQSLFAE
ncbi:pentatricopeptide repeat-containing protein 2, mitochondrial isoform X3 [Callithrix jacchus]